VARPTNPRMVARKRRQTHVRKYVQGTSTRPRLTVFRSNAHICAQVIDDHLMGESGTTLVAGSSLEKDLRAKRSEMNKRDMAREVGKLIAARSLEKGIKAVVFDRNGFLYHGRVKALAEGAREGGLEF
jgi:large subunit ribosomal protein L18